MNQIIDQAVMLFSTDWFLSQWSAFGLQADEAARKAMQKKCRSIVDQIFGGESDYWQISFDDGRLLETRKRIFSAAKECRLSEADIEIVGKIVDWDGEGENEEATVSLLWSLTQLLVSSFQDDAEDQIPRDLASKISAALFACEQGERDFVSLCLESSTDWDKKIRASTSGLPEYLGDFATGIYVRLHQFVRFWNKVKETVALSERDILIKWYEGASLELAGVNLEPPKWL
ncbi:hypothetical protein SNK19_10350 [Ralstonia pseudosolanacearum]|uniref:hypothetical protein n=1 Tax=Ralstonia pseudosolanacearum TaxID=1310165 RepID=UPI003CEFAD97